MPMASIMPIIDITLMVRPTKYITASVTSRDSGTEALTIRVVGQWRRNRNNTAKARAAPMSPASVRSLSDERIASAWLSIVKTVMPCICGKALFFSMTSSTRSTTSTTLACVDLKTSSPTAGRPSRWRRRVISGLTSSTLATSPT